VAGRNHGERTAGHDVAGAVGRRGSDRGQSVPGYPDGPVARGSETAVGSAIAVLSDDGTVVAWARGAEQLMGRSANSAVGRRADFFLGPDNGLTVSAFAERLGCPQGWSHAPLTVDGALTEDGAVTGDGGQTGDAQTMDGERIEVADLRLSRLSGTGGEVCWLLSAPGVVPDSTIPSSTTLSSTQPQRVQPEVGAGRQPLDTAVWDSTLRCAWMNDAPGEQDGVLRMQRLGRRITQVFPGFDAEALEAVMRSVLHHGTAAIDYRHQYHSDTNPDLDRTFSVSLFRLDAADGTALGVCSLVVDMTRSLRVRERLAVLGEASSRIGTTLDVMRTSQELADFAVPLIADYVTIDLAESIRLGEEPLALLSPDAGRIPVFHRTGVASIHPGLPESLWERGHPVFVPPSSPFTQVLSSGRSLLQPVLDVSSGTWFEQDPDRARVVLATGMHSLMIAPVRDGGAMLGIAVFVRNDNPVPFDEDDLALAEELVTYASRRLNEGRSYARERGAALALQRNLLPHHLSGGPAAEVASRYVPADIEEGVGGDWFDVIAMSDSRIGLVVGDIVGHGITAAAAMGRLRTAVRTLALADPPPDELLTCLDEVVINLAEGDDPGAAAPTMGATCLFVVYDPNTGRAAAARAGHPPPVIVDPEGAVTFPEIPAGAPLGFGLSSCECSEFDLAEGSLIALFTDGLVEARDWDIDVGMGRLAKALARPGLSLPDLCGAAFEAQPLDGAADQANLQIRPPSDDATLLLARTRIMAGRPGAGEGPPRGRPVA
jgi:GAF domain-containing protein